MIERLASAEKINAVLNDPSVYPWVCGPLDGPIDIGPLLKVEWCIPLFGEHGGFIFYDLGHGLYDAHSAILPNGRGRWAVRAAREALKIMFERDALEVMMAAPRGNLAVLSLIRLLKAQFRGTIENGWWLNGQPVDSDIYSLTKTDWEQCQLSRH